MVSNGGEARCNRPASCALPASTRKSTGGPHVSFLCPLSAGFPPSSVIKGSVCPDNYPPRRANHPPPTLISWPADLGTVLSRR